MDEDGLDYASLSKMVKLIETCPNCYSTNRIVRPESRWVTIPYNGLTTCKHTWHDELDPIFYLARELRCRR